MKEPNLRPACGRAFLLQRRQNTLNGGGGGGGGGQKVIIFTVHGKVVNQ